MPPATTRRPPYVHNTVFVTKGAVTHRDVYTLYSAPAYAAARARCDAALTGEDYLMSFVLARAFGAGLRLTPLFTPPREMCDIDCELAKQSLGVRSSSRRPALLRALFDEFGDPFAAHPSRAPAFMALNAQCDARCHEERHARVMYLTSDGRGNDLRNNYRTFCRNCAPALRPVGLPCPTPSDGWTVEVPATIAHGNWVVAAADLVTEEQRQLARRVNARVVDARALRGGAQST